MNTPAVDDPAGVVMQAAGAAGTPTTGDPTGIIAGATENVEIVARTAAMPGAQRSAPKIERVTLRTSKIVATRSLSSTHTGRRVKRPALL